MDFTNEGGLIIMTLMMILVSSWTAIAAAPRYAYVPPMEYDQIEFDLDSWTSERLRRTMRFTKNEIRSSD